jgi:hypothetical protein
LRKSLCECIIAVVTHELEEKMQSKWLSIALVCGSFALMLIGIASIIAYFSAIRREAVPLPWSDPIALIEAKRIAPDLALLSLAGLEDREVVEIALEAGELESAYATLLFSTTLPDVERVGKLLLLARKYAGGGEREKAVMCYELSSTIATLSLALSDFAKACIYLEAGDGLMALGEHKLAKLNYDGAYAIASFSPHLRKAHREDLLEKLVKAYRTIGEEVPLEEREAVTTAAEPKGPFLESFIWEVQELPEVVSIEEERRKRAEKLIEGLESGVEEPEDLVGQLAQALKAEDEAKLLSYEQLSSVPSPLPRRAAIAKAKAEWLTIKYRIASRGYGLSILPDWEEEIDDIRAELCIAYSELHELYNYQILALPEESQRLARMEMLREMIKVGRLGLYPDYPEEEFIAELEDIVVELPLLIEVVSIRGSNFFTLTGVR